MNATSLLDELRQMGATVVVVDGRLRIEAPRGRVTPELRSTLADHKAELLTLLSNTLPAADPRRLDLADCIELLDEMHAGIRADYEPGALKLLDVDPDLNGRFEVTKARIDQLARVAGGPTEADFREAIEGYAVVWREIIARHRAHREREAERADPMPELPADAMAAVGVSYGDGEPGTWDMVRRGR